MQLCAVSCPQAWESFQQSNFIIPSTKEQAVGVSAEHPLSSVGAQDSHRCHSLALWPWEGHLTSLGRGHWCTLALCQRAW